jgi:hypothetical protein
MPLCVSALEEECERQEAEGRAASVAARSVVVSRNDPFSMHSRLPIALAIGRAHTVQSVSHSFGRQHSYFRPILRTPSQPARCPEHLQHE